MAVQIRLARHGSKKTPFYRIVVADQHSPRDGRYIERLGTFDPAENRLECNRERFEYWQQHGAQPTATVVQLLKRRAAEAATP